MGAIGRRFSTWKRRNPQLAIGGLLVAVALLIWAGYEGMQFWEARSQFGAAKEAVERRDWKKARDLLKKANAAWPDRPDTLLLAARVERRLENLDEAKKGLDTCERLAGGETTAIQVERALLRVHAGELAPVEPFLRERIQADDPDAVEILDILSAALEVNFRVAEAQRCLDDLLRRQPDQFDALVRRGRTARAMGWYEDAVQYFDKALAIRPDVDPVRTLLAECLGNYGKFDRAREQFERLLERQPDNGSLRFGLALCLAGTGESEQALRIFNELLVQNPKNWMVLLERGKLAMQRDRPEVGLPDLLRADELAPPDTSPTTLIACLLQLGKAGEARTYQVKADRILAERKRTSDLGDLIRGTGVNDPEPRWELGAILLRQGRQQEGVHWLRAALEKDPNHRKSHETLVAFFESVNAADQADIHRRALRRLPGGNPPPR